MTNLNPDILRIEIENLLRELPELADDDELRLNMLEGSTDMVEVLNELVAKTTATKTLMNALSERIDDMNERHERLDHRCKSLRNAMLKILQAAELKKLELPEATLSQRNSPPQLVGNVDPELLPDDLCKIKREPNRSAIREALLRGDLVPGMNLSNAPPSLTISTR